MALDVWIGILAFVLLVVGAAISIHPPQERQWKIVSFVAVVVAGLCLLTLTAFQAAGHRVEQEDALNRQQHLQESLDRSQKEFRDLRQQVLDAQKTATQPGTSDERLSTVLSGISKALGQQPPRSDVRSSALPPAIPTLTTTTTQPISFLRGVPFKGGTVQRLDLIMKAAGYNGTTEMTFLYVTISEDNLGDVYLNTRPDLNEKNSRRFSNAEGYNFGEDDSSRIYVLSPKDGKLDIDYRPKR